MATNKQRIRPEGIVQSDIQVKLVEAIVKEAYLDLATYADRLDKGTLSAKSKAIRNIANKYDLQLEAWANITIPSLYYEGMTNAVNASIKGGQVYEFSQSFVSLHQEALEALISQTYTYTSKISQGIQDTGTRALTFAEQEKIKAEIGKGLVTGADQNTIAKGVTSVLKQAQATAVVSVSGKRQGIDTYASTVARSILTDAQWQGTSNTIIQEGYDLVQVSDHFGECALCRPYENEVLSLTGRTRGYTTLAEATSNGLKHPNCRHSISPFTEGLAEVSKVWDTETQSYQPKENVKSQNKTTNSPKSILRAYEQFTTKIGIKDYNLVNQAIKNKDIKALEAIQKSTKDEKLKDSIGQIIGYVGNLPGVVIPKVEKVKTIKDIIKESSKYKIEGLNKDYDLIADFLKVETTVGKSKKGTNGTYNVNNNLITVNPNIKNKDDVSKNFYHELGHAIDFKFAVGSPKAKEISEFIKPENVSEFSYKFVPKSEKLWVSDKFLQQRYIPEYNSNMNRQEINMLRKKYGSYFDMQRNYTRFEQESFAEGFAIYKTNPKELKENAPNLYKFYDDIYNEILNKVKL
jgi:hypothetical protein